jgi:2,4-dienoyl-CoA reductase-like NADH-dependent reductase (Old Yellow Enzyme family)/nucleotide-binding universal stress UspA family protein
MVQPMSKFPHLFKAFDIPPVHLKNKITMAPLFTAYANGDGTVSELTLDHYRNLAIGGAAMIVVANAAVDHNGILSRYSLRVDDQRFLPGLKQLAETIKKEGAAAVLQLNHGGRFACGDIIYAPSSVSITDINIGGFYKTALKSQNFQRLWAVLTDAFQQRAQRLTEMADSDIKHVIMAYAKAAVRSKKAGFDMVEIHGGTGYLPVQFLSQRTNKRKDKYGGSLENRMRFPMELAQSVKDAVGPDFPVGYRFLADEWLRGGFSLDEAKIFAKALSGLRVAYFSVTGGSYESFFEPEIIEKSNEPGYMVYLAEQIKRQVDLPVIATGRITEPRLAEEILKKQHADLIGLARPLFADPLWPQKAQSGEEDTIVPCENCGTCFQLILTNRPALCSQWDKTKMIRRKSMSKKVRAPRMKILLAVDGSEDSVMGASYAADMLVNRKDVTVKILHIQTEESIKNKKETKEMIDLAQSLLLETGIPKEAISIHVRKENAGVARDILDEIKEGGYNTVILGRRGNSGALQFLFGSVSKKVLQNTKDCTVWVVD